MCTQFLQHVPSPTPFPCYLPPPHTGTTPPLSRTCSTLLFSDHVNEKEKNYTVNILIFTFKKIYEHKKKP
jgi:hypothetical protein